MKVMADLVVYDKNILYKMHNKYQFKHFSLLTIVLIHNEINSYKTNSLIMMIQIYYLLLLKLYKIMKYLLYD